VRPYCEAAHPGRPWKTLLPQFITLISDPAVQLSEATSVDSQNGRLFFRWQPGIYVFGNSLKIIRFQPVIREWIDYTLTGMFVDTF
jgi:hypothetical protein